MAAGGCSISLRMTRVTCFYAVHAQTGLDPESMSTTKTRVRSVSSARSIPKRVRMSITGSTTPRKLAMSHPRTEACGGLSPSWERRMISCTDMISKPNSSSFNEERDQLAFVFQAGGRL